MFDGAHGPAPQLAMSIIVRMADVYGADELMDISQAHIDSTIYLGDATLEFAERLARSARASRCRPASTSAAWTSAAGRTGPSSPSGPPRPRGRCSPTSAWARCRRGPARRTRRTCAPSFGQQIAWGESNAIAFANSVIGARTERYPDLLDICCAITGRVPAVGLHLTENRAGQMLLRLAGVPAGAAAGRSVLRRPRPSGRQARRGRIPVIDGIVVSPAEDQLKAFARGGGVVRPRRAVSHRRRHAGGADARGGVSADARPAAARSRSPSRICAPPGGS